ncbi:MAG: F0F1 ATP synthase subunit beta [Parcubacteria group bacterium 21-54-25]|nr:MAG: F0F1 ATP synthase subunit beta [Parcubacteria group bacterium 21-54-25]HQU08239.1 F0F1 ATP synthase subunit beta [Candidatus Paceibacterota bacterium]
MENITKQFVGRVHEIRGQIVIVHRESEYLPSLGEVLSAQDEKIIVRLEVHSYRDRDFLYCLLLSSKEDLYRYLRIVTEGVALSIPAGKGVLGRAINFYGEPVDGGEALTDVTNRPIRPVAAPASFGADSGPRALLETGIKIIDFFTPVAKGGKLGLVGGAGVGKTALMTEIIRNLNATHEGVTLFAGIGERIREGHELWESLKATKTLFKTALIVAHINENAAVRFKVAEAAAALAEYFRDEEKTDVLIFADNIFRFVQAGNELSTLLEEIPSEFGYQSTLETEVARFENRLASNHRASISSIQTVYVPADELADPAVSAPLKYFESVVVLSRDMSQEGMYPAIDLLKSKSTLLDRGRIDDRHFEAATTAAALLDQYERLARVVTIIGANELSLQDKTTYERGLRLRNYMTQPFFTLEAQTGQPGVFVQRTDIITDVKSIVEGRFDSVPPEKFLYIGNAEHLVPKIS